MAEQYVISPSQFFTKTIGQDAASFDYHRQYLFKVILQKIPDATQEGLITYFVASTATPVETTGTINVDWMNSQTKIGGRTTYGDWSVTVRDDSSSVAYKYFRAWRKLVYETKSGQSSIPRDYKFTIDLYMLDNRGQEQRGYKVVNAWPTSIGQMTFDHSTENIITFPVTLQMDEFVPIIPA